MTHYKRRNGGNLERRLTIRLDAERFDRLEEYAKRDGYSVSLIVRHLLCRFLEEQRKFAQVAR
jgi:predicted DNA-binding protein